MLPYLQETKSKSKKYSIFFRGLNYGEGTQDGEFAETHNLSTDKYPCITQRATRIKAGEYANPSTLHAKGKLLVIDGTDVLYDGKKVGEVTEGKKQTATVGNYIIIFPDKKYYKVPTEDDQDGEFGSMEIDFKVSGVDISAGAVKLITSYSKRGVEFSTNSITTVKDYVTTASFISPSNTADVRDYIILPKPHPFVAGNEVTISGAYYQVHNFTATISEVKKDEDGYKIYFPINTFSRSSSLNTDITISRTPDKFPFMAGETITISGCEEGGNNKAVVVKEATEDKITFEEGTFTEATEYGEITITRELTFPFKEGDAVTISGCSDNGNNKEAEIIIRSASDTELTFDDNAFTEATEYSEINIKRTVPDLDFICESNYRLWGTHGNTIYSSKFSDPFNFKVFDGLSSDSYAIDVGSEGEFTGCIPYSSHICFFKENTLHKLYGTKPSNFQITTANIYGVQSGSEKSMQIVNEQLLYKGVGGVYSYTGGVPELISEKFGNRRYSDAVACCDGEKYYISMKQGDTWDLFTYDVLKNIWLREDDTHAVDMAFYDGKVYYLDSGGELYYIDKTADRGDIDWGATFCTIHETVNEKKGYSKFHLRMDLSAGAWLAVDIKTDNDLQWQQVYTTHNEKAKTVSIPIMPTRCDSIDIRLRGRGKCTVRAFIREFSVGSDV